MGLLDRFFRRDPKKALERAEGLLARGEAAPALRLAEQTLKGGSLAQGHRAESLVRRAKQALVAAAREKADLAEASGFYEDAAEWIAASLEHAADEGERSELECRSAELLDRAAQEERRRRAANRFEFPEGGPETADEEEGVDSEGPEFDVDLRYEALVNTLDDDVAERYDSRPESFRRAFVELNEGRPREALSVFEELAEAHPDDPVYLLERGRSRLLLHDFVGARSDLEAVWETFGDEPLDHARTLSVPGMWSEALLGAGEPETVVERLDDVAVPQQGDHILCHNYVLALMMTKRLDEARSYLVGAIDHFSQPDFPYQLAAVLHAQGRTGEAIDTLERSIAPSCTPGSPGGGLTGNCRSVPKHVPSLRSLVGLYLGEGRGHGRVEELLSHIAQAQGGRLEAEDYLLLAEYHQQQDDAEAAAEATAKARALRQEAAAKT